MATKTGRLYNRALSALEYLVNEYYCDQEERLRQLVRFSKGFERNFGYTRHTKSAVAIEPRWPGKEYFGRDPLQWCLLQLDGTLEDLKGDDKCVIFNMLASLLRDASPRERERVDHRPPDYIADMAALHEIRAILCLQRPLHNQSFNCKDVSESDKSRMFWRTCMASHDDMLESKRTELEGLLMDLYHVKLRPNEQNKVALVAQIDAHHKLMTFWSRARAVSERTFAKYSDDDRKAELSLLDYHNSSRPCEPFARTGG